MRAAVLAIVLAALAGLQQQEGPFDRIAACFQSLQTAAPARLPPTDEEVRRLLRITTSCGWLMVQAKLSASEAAAISDVDLEVEDEVGPAARVLGRTIHVSIDGIAQAGQVGQVVGHDIFVEDGNTFPVMSTVAYGPLAAQPITGLTDRLSGWIDNAASATACQDQDCKIVQGLAIFLGIDGFLLAHETAHLLHRDEGSDELARELAADRWAYGLLRRYDGEFETSDTLRLARTAARLAPVVYFDYLRSRLTTGEAVASDSASLQVLTRRREQLAELADPGDRLILDTLRPSMDTGVGRVLVLVEGADGQPVRVWIDGVPLTGEDVLGHERTLAAGLRHIAARAGGRFAHATELITRGERRSVLLRLSAPLPSLPVGDLGTLAKRRDGPRQEKWTEIFLHTTDESGNPRSPDVALMHYQALSRMGLGLLIPPNPPGLTDAAALRSAARWRRIARPLAGWW